MRWIYYAQTIYSADIYDTFGGVKGINFLEFDYFYKMHIQCVNNNNSLWDKTGSWKEIRSFSLSHRAEEKAEVVGNLRSNLLWLRNEKLIVKRQSKLTYGTFGGFCACGEELLAFLLLYKDGRARSASDMSYELLDKSAPRPESEPSKSAAKLSASAHKLPKTS